MPQGLKTSIILSIQYVHGDLCKHLGIDSSTNRIRVPIEYLSFDWYSNL